MLHDVNKSSTVQVYYVRALHTFGKVIVLNLSPSALVIIVVHLGYICGFANFSGATFPEFEANQLLDVHGTLLHGCVATPLPSIWSHEQVVLGPFISFCHAPHFSPAAKAQECYRRRNWPAGCRELQRNVKCEPATRLAPRAYARNWMGV